MYIGFASDVLPPNKITDYLIRVVQPKLQASKACSRPTSSAASSSRCAPGSIRTSSPRTTLPRRTSAPRSPRTTFSRRGRDQGQMVQVNLTASTNLRSVEEFKESRHQAAGWRVVRLSDVAKVTLGAEDYESEVGFDGKKLSISASAVAPAANLLDVIARVRNVFPGIKAQLPQGLQGQIVYDSTKFVNSAIDEVIWTLAQALVIVTTRGVRFPRFDPVGG